MTSGWDLWVATAPSEADAEQVAHDVRQEAGGEVVVLVDARRRGNLLGTLDALAFAEARHGPLDDAAVAIVHDAGAATRSAGLAAGRRGALVVGATGRAPLTLLGAVVRAALPAAAVGRRGRADLWWCSQLLLLGDLPAVDGDVVKRFVPGVEDHLDDLGLARISDGAVVDFRPRGALRGAERAIWLGRGPAWRDVGGGGLSIREARTWRRRFDHLEHADVDPVLVGPRVAAGEHVGAADLGAGTGWLRLRRADEWRRAASAILGTGGSRWRALLGLEDEAAAASVWGHYLEAPVAR